jgi:hypothetical protein
MTGLDYALCAISFYRGRHKRPTRTRRGEPSEYAIRRKFLRDVWMARYYISEARRKGFRGSVLQAIGRRTATI